MIPQAYFDKVKNHFNGDMKKTWEWFQFPNGYFGMLSPLMAMKLGRENQVKQFIDKEFK